MSTICPSLYKDKEGRFICGYAQQEVDPVFMPCLSNYMECPIYIAAMGKKEEKREEELHIRLEKEELLTVEEPRIEVEEEVAAEKEEKELELVKQFEDMLREIDDVDSQWVAYETSANNLLKKWDKLRSEALRTLASIDSIIQAYNDEFKEIEMKHDFGFLNDEDYERFKEKLEKNMKKYEDTRTQIIDYLDTIEARVLNHYQRLKITAAKPDIGKLKVSLMKLEEMYSQGKIDKNTYEKVKSEIEYEIKRLEKLVG